MAPLVGGVPERPKGTGCKPVGSAYGGSNPPAPTHSLFRAGAAVSTSSAFGLREELEQLANGLVAERIVPKWLGRNDAEIDASAVPAGVAVGLDVARFAQVAQDEVDAPLGEIEPLGYVANAQLRLMFDREQEPSMVRQ